MRCLTAGILFLALITGACGSGGKAETTAGAADTGAKVMPVITIENTSQFVLYEVRVHPDPDYLDSPNRLEQDMAVNGSLTVSEVGEWYITFIRDKIIKDGGRIAFTTAYPLKFEYNTNYRVTIFDESFRVREEEEE